MIYRCVSYTVDGKPAAFLVVLYHSESVTLKKTNLTVLSTDGLWLAGLSLQLDFNSHCLIPMASVTIHTSTYIGELSWLLRRLRGPQQHAGRVGRRQGGGQGMAPSLQARSRTGPSASPPGGLRQQGHSSHASAAPDLHATTLWLAAHRGTGGWQSRQGRPCLGPPAQGETRETID